MRPTLRKVGHGRSPIKFIMFIIEPKVAVAYRALRINLTTDAESAISWEVLKENIPPGWIHCIEYLEALTEQITEYKLKEVKIEKGVLRIRSEHPNQYNEKIFEYVAQFCAQATSKACIVCGEKGFRRKREERWPSLCTSHYIQYRNLEFQDE